MAALHMIQTPKLDPRIMRYELAAGRSVRWVADQLGHADPGLTLRVYAHALPTEEHDLAFARLPLLNEVRVLSRSQVGTCPPFALRKHKKLARFMENHDEPRAAATFTPDVHKAAAIITYLSPGLRFFHQGHLEGRRKRVLPHLIRAPLEQPDRAAVCWKRQAADPKARSSDRCLRRAVPDYGST